MIIFEKKIWKDDGMILKIIMLFFCVLIAPFSYSQTQIKIATLAPQNSDWANRFIDGSKEIA